MKKMTLMCGSLAAATLLLFTQCNQTAETTPSAASTAAGTSMKIAYVEVDSLMNNYNFAKDYTALLTKKSESIQSTLASKGQALQNRAADFQRKIQSNAYTREQAENEQRNLQQMQQSLEALQGRLAQEFQSEQNKYNEALHDSLNHFLTQYNKDKKFSLILTKSGDNILYADKTYDITNEVVAGLNKRYKQPAELKGASTSKKEEKK